MGFKFFAQLFEMFLESSDVLQVMSCDTGQEDNVHMIQIYIVLGFLHHDKFTS